MDKPPSTAPPRHRHYPRAAAARQAIPAAPLLPARPAGGAVTGRRWPRAVPDRRVFPRV
jgi:hypothetical protein